MFSKLKRSKSSVERRLDQSGPLRGMPALKQKRSSQRHEMVSRDFLPKPAVDISEKDSKLRHNKEIHAHKEKKIPDKQSIPEDLSTKAKNHIGDNQHKDIHQDYEFESTPNGKKSSLKHDYARGKNLHSLKKERQADRESQMSKSMRALTPRERESILCLEEVLNDVFDKPEDEDFSRSFDNDTNDDHSLPSSTSSIVSVIDLVGNLYSDSSAISISTRLQQTSLEATDDSSSQSSDAKHTGEIFSYNFYYPKNICKSNSELMVGHEQLT